MLGTKLKQLREERGWTQQQLADKSGLDRGYIANLESRKSVKPSAETFIKLARAFNIDVDIIYEAAGYIKNTRSSYHPRPETPEEILERLKLASPISVPVYEEFPYNAGDGTEPLEYVYRARARHPRPGIEGYAVSGNCKSDNQDIVLVDRNAPIDLGNYVACLVDNKLFTGRVRKIAGVLYVENQERRVKLDDCPIVARIIEIQTITRV